MAISKENSKIYKKLSKPYPSQEAADDALKNFVQALYKLREKHRIPQLVFSAAVHIEKEAVVIHGSTGNPQLCNDIASLLAKKLNDAYIKSLHDELIEKEATNG